MCPNCFPALGLSAGWVIAFFVCILFFVTAVGAMMVASRSGYLDNLDEAKYRMLED